jgi:hypothetical protein
LICRKARLALARLDAGSIVALEPDHVRVTPAGQRHV